MHVAKTYKEKEYDNIRVRHQKEPTSHYSSVEYLWFSDTRKTYTTNMESIDSLYLENIYITMDDQIIENEKKTIFYFFIFLDEISCEHNDNCKPMPCWNHLHTLEVSFVATCGIPYNIPKCEIKLHRCLVC